MEEFREVKQGVGAWFVSLANSEHPKTKPVFSHDGDATRLESHLVFGGPMNLSVNHVDYELKIGEVTAHRLLDDECGDSLGIPTGLIAIEPCAESKVKCRSVKRLHVEPPALS